MKLPIVLLAIVGLSLVSASKSPEEVQAEVMAYVQTQVSSLLRSPAIARAGGGLACYDKYIPLITAATEDSKSDTASCVNRAASRREDELNKVKAQREALDQQVKTVQDTLASCVKQDDVLGFLTCFRDNSQVLQSTVTQVSLTSTSLANGLSAAYVSINTSEDSCIQTVLDKVKADTDALTVALQNCLKNGFDDGQPETSSPPSDSSSSSPVEPQTTVPSNFNMPNDELLPEENL
ncbi:protein TsetseEP [Musca domestica]|uniref:Protein TsetseEP n=1 Tax=Musca domestica TaxID=7370 RepID=A0A9J7I0Z7_MUSDO|nr:protein TsetseEP [Musca domestica]